jgi:dipeptidyl-peptidase-4
LNQYDAATGKFVKNILHETSDKYVEPQHPLSFIPGSTSQFIWWSQRDGYMHLWLVDLNKNTQKCLTPGAYVVNELLGFNASRKEIYHHFCEKKIPAKSMATH